MSSDKEIKRILLGRLVRNEQGVLIARPKGVYANVNGLVDGYFSVFLFGVMSRKRAYRWEGAKKQQTETITRYVQQLGEELKLEEHPDAIACFTGRMVFTPTVVVVEIAKEQFEVTVYTGRTPFGVLRCFLVHRRMERLLSDMAERIQEKKQK